MNAQNIREHMDVIGSCGNKLGRVDRGEGGSIKLTNKIRLPCTFKFPWKEDVVHGHIKARFKKDFRQHTSRSGYHIHLH